MGAKVQAISTPGRSASNKMQGHELVKACAANVRVSPCSQMPTGMHVDRITLNSTLAESYSTSHADQCLVHDQEPRQIQLPQAAEHEIQIDKP